VGKIEGLWMDEEEKSTILLSMEEASSKGIQNPPVPCGGSIAGAWSDGLGSGGEARVLRMASPAPKILYTGFSRRNAQP
jgi:hypothetical protein